MVNTDTFLLCSGHKSFRQQNRNIDEAENRELAEEGEAEGDADGADGDPDKIELTRAQSRVQRRRSQRA